MCICTRSTETHTNTPHTHTHTYVDDTLQILMHYSNIFNTIRILFLISFTYTHLLNQMSFSWLAKHFYHLLYWDWTTRAVASLLLTPLAFCHLWALIQRDVHDWPGSRAVTECLDTLQPVKRDALLTSINPASLTFSLLSFSTLPPFRPTITTWNWLGVRCWWEGHQRGKRVGLRAGSVALCDMSPCWYYRHIQLWWWWCSGKTDCIKTWCSTA